MKSKKNVFFSFKFMSFLLRTGCAISISLFVVGADATEMVVGNDWGWSWYDWMTNFSFDGGTKNLPSFSSLPSDGKTTLLNGNNYEYTFEGKTYTLKPSYYDIVDPKTDTRYSGFIYDSESGKQVAYRDNGKITRYDSGSSSSSSGSSGSSSGGSSSSSSGGSSGSSSSSSSGGSSGSSSSSGGSSGSSSGGAGGFGLKESLDNGSETKGIPDGTGGKIVRVDTVTKDGQTTRTALVETKGGKQVMVDLDKHPELEGKGVGDAVIIRDDKAIKNIQNQQQQEAIDMAKNREKLLKQGYSEKDVDTALSKSSNAEAGKYLAGRQIDKVSVDDKGNYTITHKDGTKETWFKDGDKDVYYQTKENGARIEGSKISGGELRKGLLDEKSPYYNSNVKYADVYKDPSTYKVVDGKAYDASDVVDGKVKDGANSIGDFDEKTGEIKFKDGSKIETVKKAKVKTVITQNVAQYVILILEALEGRKTKEVSKKVKVKAQDLQKSQGQQSSGASTATSGTQDENNNTPIGATTIADASNAMIQLLKMSVIDLGLLSESVSSGTGKATEKPRTVKYIPGGQGTALGSSVAGGTTFATSAPPVKTSTYEETTSTPTSTKEEKSTDKTTQDRKEIRKRRTLLLAEWAVAATNIGEGSNAISNQFYERAEGFVAAANAARGSLGGASAINDTDRFVLFELTRGVALSAVQLGLQGSLTLNELEETK